MASLDDDMETLPEFVSDYYFYGREDEPVSFTELPVQWGNCERSEDSKTWIYLRGTTDNGLQRLHKQVKAWKYEFLEEKPEISVLSSRDKNWIKLQKPRKSFEEEIRTILITLHCLHFFKRKPEACSRDLWDHLCKVFSLFDIRPSMNDLMEHLSFMREAVKRDQTLGKSKFLASLLEGSPRIQREFNQNAEAIMKPSFIVDDTVIEYEDDQLTRYAEEDGEPDDEVDLYDTVCAICDNGGDLICCEGKCYRAFHATVESADSNCKSVGLSAEEVKGSQSFFCLNCSHEHHQCFVCGKLGSSNRSSGAEVFCCISATCGHFYHPHCVAKLLKDESDIDALDLEEKIAAGEPFTCPAHKCHKCKHVENEKVEDLQFAICRRCPMSYHRKCLPSNFVFHNEDNDGDVIARAWNGLLPKSRALIFCFKHKMDHKLGTAVRNIKFPKIDHSTMTVAANEEVVNSNHTSDDRSSLKSKKRVEKSSSFARPVGSSRKRAKTSCGSKSVKKHRVNETYKQILKKSSYKKVIRPNLDEPSNHKEDHIPVHEDEQTPLDADSQKRILELMKEVNSSIKLGMVKRHYRGKLPFAFANLSKLDESNSVEAACLALRKLEEGCSLDDALAGCEPRVLHQLLKWKDKLKVYQAPFQHETLYPSSGRYLSEEENIKASDLTVENREFGHKFCSNNDFAIRDPYIGVAYGRADGPSSLSPDYRSQGQDTTQLHGYEKGEYGESCGFYREAYVKEHTKYGIRSSLSQMIRDGGSHQDSRFPSGYVHADPSSYNRSSSCVMQRYAPRLDELNHTWMKNRSFGVYDYSRGPHTDSSGFALFLHPKSSCGWLEE